VYKYFSGTGKVFLNTSQVSPAPERYQNAPPAPEKYVNIVNTLLRRRRRMESI